MEQIIYIICLIGAILLALWFRREREELREEGYSKIEVFLRRKYLDDSPLCITENEFLCELDDLYKSCLGEPPKHLRRVVHKRIRSSINFPNSQIEEEFFKG